MSTATIEKIRNLRDVAAQLRARVEQMSRQDYITRMLTGAEELEMMANWLEIEVEPAGALLRGCT